jgi:hypothetical protein
MTDAETNVTGTQVPPEETPNDSTETNANTGSEITTGDETKTLTMTQEHLNKLFADRAAQAKRNAERDLLKKYNFENVTELDSAMESFKEFEAKRQEQAEAEKTELQKQKELLDASIAKQVELAKQLTRTSIDNAVQRIAPTKNVPADRFPGLLKLLDRSLINTNNGEVKDEEVEAAIDATLKLHAYLISVQSGSQHGSPPSQTNSHLPANVDTENARYKKMLKLAGK